MTLTNPGPSAGDITVLQTVTTIQRDFPELVSGVADGEVVLWIGSGISLGRADGLGKIIFRVLDFVQRQVVLGDDSCIFRAALSEIVGLADLSSDERTRINLDQSVSDWAGIDELIRKLSSRYAQLLDVRISGKVDDYLVWEGVDIVHNFPSTLKPDAEHLALALLIMEGVVSTLVSANWDPLIEKAVEEASDGTQPLDVIIQTADFQLPAGHPRLHKFHGCAQKAFEDEATYRPLLIARDVQITAWLPDPNLFVQRNALVQFAVSQKTLMLGLSAQDTNIKQIFSEAALHAPRAWPDAGPAIIFGEDRLGQDQKAILKLTYSAAYESHSAEIESRSMLRAYAKQTLAALVLLVWSEKLKELADVAATKYGSSWGSKVSVGLGTLSASAASTWSPDSESSIRDLWQVFSQLHAAYLTGEHGGPVGRFRPLTTSPRSKIPTDPLVTNSGLPETAALLGLIGSGAADGAWSVSIDRSSITQPRIKVQSGSRSRQVQFFANDAALSSSIVSGHVDLDDPETVVLISISSVRSTRQPNAAPGRTGVLGAAHIPLDELLRTAPDATDAIDLFRQKAML